MNGWLRLWVFISVIWAVIVVFLAALLMREDWHKAPDYSAALKHVSDETLIFYRDFGPSPEMTVPVSFSDGSKTTVHLDLSNPINIESISSMIEISVDNHNRKALPGEVSRITKEAEKRKALLKAAIDDMEAGIKQAMRKNQREMVTLVIAIVVIPSSILLVVGSGFAWVRRGFAVSE